MDAGKEPHIKALFDRLKEIHYQVMGDVVATQRQRVFIIRPGTFHQLRLESLLLEETLLVCGVDRSFAREADVADANVFGVNSGGGGFLAGAAQKQSAEAECNDEFCK